MTEATNDLMTSSIDRIIHRDRKLPLSLARACVAKLLDEAYNRSSVGSEAFINTVHNSFAAIGGIPDDLNSFELINLPGKRQPSLMESLEATPQRYELLNQIRANLGMTAFYGGSMAYGPFYNVRGGADASDLDVVVVFDEESTDDDPFIALGYTGIVTQDAVETAQDRLAIFRQLFERREASIISQKFETPQGFDISVHAMPRSTFAMIYNDDALAENAKDGVHYIDDYRIIPIRKGLVTDYTSTGMLVENRVVSRLVQGGFISHIPSYGIYGGGQYYVPGLYQDLFSPKPGTICIGDEKDSKVMDDFVGALHKRILVERRHSPNASLRNTKSRNQIMPPDIPKRLREELEIHD